MKQLKIDIQLEFHQEIANMLFPFIFPLNLEICCVTSLVNRPAGLHEVRAVAARVSESLMWQLWHYCASCHLLTLLEVDSDAAE